MRIAAAVILLFAVLMPFLSRLTVYASFKLNQKYIAENLCVNRNVKDSACNGNCQLMKRLEQQDRQEKESTRIQQSNEITLYHKANLEECLPIGTSVIVIDYSCLSTAPTRSFAGKIFHPPQ